MMNKKVYYFRVKELEQSSLLCSKSVEKIQIIFEILNTITPTRGLLHSHDNIRFLFFLTYLLHGAG